jgi:hypothetical protein
MQMSTILVPQDQKLKPTKNIYKVRGTQFVAIGVNTKEHPGITERELRERQRKGTLGLEETLYELE